MKGYIYSILGNLYLATDKRRALICFEKALDKNTKNALAIYNYGLVLLQDGEFNKSLDLFFKADYINKSKLGKRFFSKNAKNRALLLEKNIPLAISSCYWKLNELDKAIQTLEDLRVKYSYVSANTLTTLGYLYLLIKDYEKAEEISKLAIEDEPAFSSAWDNLGQIYLEQGIKDKAKESFLKAIEYNPYSVESLYYLGILEQENDISKATEYFNRALKCNITSLNTISREDIEKSLSSLKKLDSL